MIEFLLAGQNLPFSVAICLMLAIAFMEGVGTLLGLGLSEAFETFMPDFDLDVDVDIDADVDGADINPQSGLTKILGWLRIGEVPFLMLLVVFLTVFGLIGLGIQSLAQEMAGHLLPGIAAATMAFFISMPFVRLFGGILAKVMPKDETDAVSENSFIGRVASITLGRADKGNPTRAKLQDKHGTTHYIMVEPDLADDVFEQGGSVILVSRNGAVFKAIHNTSAGLKD
jgi:Inner membrane protein YqiJ, N-terminal/Inner membrane protein YqiJ, OB-fold